MNRNELINSKEYWIVQIQNGLYNLIDNYRTYKGLNKSELAKELGVSKGYVSQILNGDFDHKISKLVELSLHCGKVPVIHFEDKSQFVERAACTGKHPVKFELNLFANSEFKPVITAYASGDSHVHTVESNTTKLFNGTQTCLTTN